MGKKAAYYRKEKKIKGVKKLFKAGVPPI